MQQALAAKFPGTSLASELLQRDTWQMLRQFERDMNPGCDDLEVVLIELVKPIADGRWDDGKLMSGTWVELWRIDRCGESIAHPVTFEADGQGGTIFRIEMRQGAVQ